MTMKLLADEGADRAGGETRGPHPVPGSWGAFKQMTPEQQRADRDRFWAQLAAVENIINRLDPTDPYWKEQTDEPSSAND
jgi:hypothetical protein